MRIGMILGLPFPPDVRVEKEARALTKAGYEDCRHERTERDNRKSTMIAL